MEIMEIYNPGWLEFLTSFLPTLSLGGDGYTKYYYKWHNSWIFSLCPNRTKVLQFNLLYLGVIFVVLNGFILSITFICF